MIPSVVHELGDRQAQGASAASLAMSALRRAAASLQMTGLPSSSKTSRRMGEFPRRVAQRQCTMRRWGISRFLSPLSDHRQTFD